MRYKYAVGLLVALSLGSGLGVAAEVVDIEEADYKGIYGALTSDCAGLAKIRAVLKNNKDLNPEQDPRIARGQLIGFGLSTAVMGLTLEELQQVVDEHREFFTTTPQGMSYVYGWALNKYEAVVTPRNIGNGFSFHKLFQGMATNIGDSDRAAGIFLSSTFITGLGVVETSREHRWNFFHHMLDLPPAIRELRKTAAAVIVAPTMDAIIAGARRTKAEARIEAANLLRAPGRAAHLVDNLGDAQANWDADNFVGLQKYTLQVPKLCETINPTALAIFQSLPVDTDIEVCTFMGQSVAAHMEAFRGAIEIAREAASEAEDAPLPVAAFLGVQHLAVLDEVTAVEHLASVLTGDEVTIDKAMKLQVLLKGHKVIIPPVHNARITAFEGANLAEEATFADQAVNFRTLVDAIRQEEALRAAKQKAHADAIGEAMLSFQGLQALSGAALMPTSYDVNCRKAVGVASRLLELGLMQEAYAKKIRESDILGRLSGFTIDEDWTAENPPVALVEVMKPALVKKQDGPQKNRVTQQQVDARNAERAAVQARIDARVKQIEAVAGRNDERAKRQKLATSLLNYVVKNVKLVE